LRSLAPVTSELARGVGKAALAQAPSVPLPEEVVARSKIGFGVPTGRWMSAAFQPGSAKESLGEPKGLVSRRWSRVVLSDRSLTGSASAKAA
jgi:asparagine synthase (glutamine-hydrolysing)